MAPWQMYLVLTGQTTIEYYFYKAMAAVGNTTVNVVSNFSIFFFFFFICNFLILCPNDCSGTKATAKIFNFCSVMISTILLFGAVQQLTLHLNQLCPLFAKSGMQSKFILKIKIEIYFIETKLKNKQIQIIGSIFHFKIVGEKKI